MICYRCQKQITKRVRTRKVKDGIGTTTYCRHCYKAITGKKRMADCFEYETIDIGGEINAENRSNKSY